MHLSVKCWLYGNKQTSQGPCPLEGQVRNKLWIEKKILGRKGTQHTYIRHACST